MVAIWTFWKVTNKFGQHKFGPNFVLAKLGLAKIGRGPEPPSTQPGLRMLGVPIGREDYVTDHLAKKTEEHQIVIDRIPLVQDMQSASTTDRCGNVSINWLGSRAFVLGHGSPSRFRCLSDVWS